MNGISSNSDLEGEEQSFGTCRPMPAPRAVKALIAPDKTQFFIFIYFYVITIIIFP
jgi:hypothetical protein